jgi:hypothetical protein
MIFKRGTDVKEALGIGEAPTVKEIREHLNEIITNRITVWSTTTSRAENFNDDITWKSVMGNDGNNIHKLIGVTATHDFASLKSHVKFIKHDIKGVFNSHDRKLTAINFYTTLKWFNKYGMEKIPNAVMIEIIYSKKKK